MGSNIIGTGLSGLVGSRVTELLSSKYTFEDLSRKTGVDITNAQRVKEKIAAFDSSYVLHFASYTQVDAAEVDRSEGYNSTAWKINVGGTRNVIAACEASGKPLIFFSTDMVFPGEKAIGQKYTEEENPEPVGWYATTKYHAEKLVMHAKVPWTIIRIAYPYRAAYEKKEYVRIFLSLLKEKKPITAVSDHYFTPTYIDDLSLVIRTAIEKKLTGIYHAVGDEIVSPYEVAIKVAHMWDLDETLITKTTREVYFKGGAPRGFNLSLNNDKIKKLGIHMRSFTEGLTEICK